MSVKQNMGLVDRVIRIMFALVLLGNGLYFGWSWAVVMGSLLGLTAVVGSCPAYLPFGFSSKGMPTPKL
ncbi:MAG: DUF2892 domain-containing protein [Acidiferrobacterales bacterium]|nr:DUF2892 domain-containing protein [Acidiferrobacterales bacterium]